MFEKKIKFVWGCGASRQYESISISKNKAPPLLLQMVNWSPFRHYHCVYYLRECLRPKMQLVFGGVVVADSPKVFPFLKIKYFFYYFKGVTGVHLDITIVLLSQSLFENKNKLVWGCSASRQSERISISKKKSFPVLFQRVNWSPFRHYHCFTITANV